MSNSYTVNPTKPYLGASADFGAAQAFDMGGPVDDEGSGGDNSQAQGAIPTEASAGSDQGQGQAQDTGDVSSALDIVKEAIGLRRQQNGLGGGNQQVAAADTPKTRAMPASQSEINDNSPQSWGGNAATQTVRGPIKFDPRAFINKQKTSALDTGDEDTQSLAKGGSVQAFDPGGSVEDQLQQGSDDSTDQAGGPAPAPQPIQQGSDDSTDQSSQGQPQQAIPEQGQPSFPGGTAPHQLLRQGAQRLINYIRGGDGDQNLANQMAQKVDPQGQMDPDTRNLKAVEAAHEDGGPEAAAKVVAANMQSFNAKQAFARAALNGSPNKAPDIPAAAQAATQAFTHMLDGKSAVFTPTATGVTVAVKTLGEDKPAAPVDLNTQQFDDLLHMGKSGLYDNLYERGLTPVLQTLKQQKNMSVPAQRLNESGGQSQPQGQADQTQGSSQAPGQADQTQGQGQPQGRQSLQFNKQGQVTDPQAAKAQGWVQDPNGVWQPPGRHVESAPYGGKTKVYSDNVGPNTDSGHEAYFDKGTGDQPGATVSPQQWLRERQQKQTSVQSDQVGQTPQKSADPDDPMGFNSKSMQQIKQDAADIYPMAGDPRRQKYVQDTMAAQATHASSLSVAKNSRLYGAQEGAKAKMYSSDNYVKGKDYQADQKLAGELAKANSAGASAQDAHLASVYNAEEKTAGLLGTERSAQSKAIAKYFLDKTQGAPARGAAPPGATANAPSANVPTMQKDGKTYYKVQGGWSSQPPQ
jgi:hypothetical protein